MLYCCYYYTISNEFSYNAIGCYGLCGKQLDIVSWAIRNITKHMKQEHISILLDYYPHATSPPSSLFSLRGRSSPARTNFNVYLMDIGLNLAL